MKIDPNWVDAHHFGADAALWMGHENSQEYLRELDKAMTPGTYNAASSILFCQAVLGGHPELRACLGPLVELLARKALAKDPNNPDCVKVVDAALKGAAGSHGP